MIRYCILATSLSWLISCDLAQQESKSVGYFDTDSLISESLNGLSFPLTLEKNVNLGSGTDIKKLNLSLEELQTELEVFEAINPNQPEYKNAWKIAENATGFSYTTLNPDKTELQSLNVMKEDESVVSISARTTSQNSVFSTSRSYLLTFIDGTLSEYQIEGSEQRHILKDSSSFLVTCKIL